MSIQKISQNELLSLGVSALPNRPSAPSLYSGRTLSATELKEAFDRLPTLIAERFNALLAATGLFDSENPKESLAELIATKHAPYHSLADFFADVENGNLALYFSVDGKDSLADVLEEMREDLLSLKSRSFSLEGDGDILTDAIVEGPFITLQKGMKSEDLLAAANAYTDTPKGRVEAGCDLPISGNEVAKAIEKLCTPEKTNERLSRLEAASEGILFNYPIEDSTCGVLRAPAHVMSYGALCRLGGAPIPQKNLLPEKILSTYRGENLTVTWDNAEGCLIFNGTVTAAESPVILSVFEAPATYGYYHAAIFPHGGSKVKPTGSGNVHLRFYTEDEKYVSLDLSKDIPLNTGTLLRTGGEKFSHVAITTNTTMQFKSYKINILLQAESCDEPVYAPYESLTTPSPIPSKITACSPNEWEGEFSKEGLGGVTFLPQKTYSDGRYAVSFFATADGASDTCHIYAYLENGRVIKRDVWTDERSEVILDLDAPVTMFKLLPMATEEESAPYTIRVKDFQVERESPIYEFAYDFSTPYSHTLSLPESFSRYADRFIGMGNEICNHFDFERGMFVTTVKCYRMDDTLSFSADTEIASRFHAAVTLPEDLIASLNYMPSSLFHPLTDETACDECVWFTEEGITLQSDLFKTAEDIPAFFAIHPINILYEVPAEKEFLTQEEADFFSPPLLPLVPDANITLYDSDDTPIVGFVRMQYETKNLPEEEIV